MLKRKPFFKYGFLMGMFMLIVQQIVFNLFGMTVLIILYMGIFLLPIFMHKGKLSLGIFVGYTSSFIIFILLVYVAYNIMVYIAE